MNHFKYARHRYSYWLGWLSVLIGIVAIIPFPEQCPITVPIAIVSFCFILAFIIPFVGSFVKTEYSIATIGKSNISLRFGSIFEQECFAVTTNRNFDVIPDETYISSTSLLAKFVNAFYPNDISSLINEIASKLETNNDGTIKRQQYGKTIQINKDSKIVYLMAFTDRDKNNQPDDFYIKAIRGFLKEISNSNHGRTVSIPLFGSNNSLSNSGFENNAVALESIVTMIKLFEIENQRSELKIQIVVLPEARSEIIDTIARLSK
ncbi:MAG: DUF6430 domain-containing protein [Ruminococcus sp.]|nr:DUF6430 domain-containing protein [Ruminococcus sp.]